MRQLAMAPFPDIPQVYHDISTTAAWYSNGKQTRFGVSPSNTTLQDVYESAEQTRQCVDLGKR